MLYTVQGNFGLALGDFTVAITLDPSYHIALNNRAVVHAAEGSFDLASADIEAALALNAQEPAHYATRSAIYLALALKDYAEYRTLAGLTAPYPAGSPAGLVEGLQAGADIGSFSAWLGLLSR
jgi:tetratricopeptide (TPR) repeat protein